MADDPDAIPASRLRRAAGLGQALGLEGARYARTRAAGLVRSEERRADDLERHHRESARRLAATLGTLRGAAQKLGQLASFVDADLVPASYRHIYQEELAALRSAAPAMPWARVRSVLEQEWEAPPESMLAHLDHDAAAAASIGQVHRGMLPDGRAVAVKIQYPGVAEAVRADMGNAAVLLRLARAMAPGLDARSAAAELRERVLEELDYELEAQRQRRFARAYRGHPFIRVPEVVTRLSRPRVLVSEWVEGRPFAEVLELPQAERDRFGEIVFRFCFGSVYHVGEFNADAHPGNYLLEPDGRVAFLDFGMTKRLEREQVRLEVECIAAVLAGDARALHAALDRLGFLPRAERVEPERILAHVTAVGGWYMEDRPVRIDADRVMRALSASSDPRSEWGELMRQENIPAGELLGRRMEIGVLAVLGQLEAESNWCAIGREWWFGHEPTTELGHREWEFFAARGVARRPLRP